MKAIRQTRPDTRTRATAIAVFATVTALFALIAAALGFSVYPGWLTHHMSMTGWLAIAGLVNIALIVFVWIHYGRRADGRRVRARPWVSRDDPADAYPAPIAKAGIALSGDVRDAIVHRAILPYFDPQIDLRDGRLVGFEVLARWHHPILGTIPPDKFVPIAEQAGLIGDLSIAIMRQAFAAARDWDPGLTLSINLSAMQMRDAWLAQKIIKTLVETGFPASRLEIEITERALIDNIALAQSIAISLKNQGIRLALDDFGTGLSSLAHLRAMPFDRVKIDTTLILTMHENSASGATVAAIIRMAESLNLSITAEGLERPELATYLADLGCHQGQGYLYGQPMDAAHTRRMLAERGALARVGPGTGTGMNHRLVG